MNQAERRGPFLWARHYRGSLQSETPHGAEASHTGWAGRDVAHQRRVDLEEDTLIVLDRLTGKGRHRVRITWPLDGDTLESRGSGVALTLPRGRVTLEVEGPGEGRIERGDPGQPGTPCISDGYDRMRPGVAWIWEAEVTLPATWTTRVRCRPA